MREVQSELFKSHKDILHAYTTKKGGFSNSPFLGNNLAFHVNDNPSNVNKNHVFSASHLNYPLQKLARMNQVHGNKIVKITDTTNLNNIPACDALITNVKHIPLMVMVADCIPILVYDPVHKAVASIHAGRAGTFTEILPLCIQKMKHSYQSNPKDLLVSVGPSIHQCCYEVGKEIVEEAKKENYEYAIEKRNSRYYLNLIAIIKKQLSNLKIETNNIDISTYCTACNTNLFYSYRVEKQCGRFAGIIMLK